MPTFGNYKIEKRNDVASVFYKDSLLATWNSNLTHAECLYRVLGLHVKSKKMPKAQYAELQSAITSAKQYDSDYCYMLTCELALFVLNSIKDQRHLACLRDMLEQLCELKDSYFIREEG